MPITHLQDRLQRVVVGVGLDLVDHTEVGKLCEEWTSGLLCPVVCIYPQGWLIDIRRSQQAMRSAAHITDLQEHRTAKALLNIQVVVVAVGSAEVLADGEYVENLSATVSR